MRRRISVLALAGALALLAAPDLAGAQDGVAPAGQNADGEEAAAPGDDTATEAGDDVAPAAALGGPGPQPPAPPVIGATGLSGPQAHCTFLPAGDAIAGELPVAEGGGDVADRVQPAADAPSPAVAMEAPEIGAGQPAAVFVTERAYDGMVVIERGYARIDGLLRELVFVARDKAETGETWRYDGLGRDAPAIRLVLKPAQMTKTETLWDGSMEASRDGLTATLAVTGVCAPDAINRRAKP